MRISPKIARCECRYIKYVAGEHGQTLNRLLVKDQVGHPRPTTYRLPPPDQAFGVKNPDAAFGAHDGMSLLSVPPRLCQFAPLCPTAIAYWNAPNVKPQKGRPTGPDLTNRVFGVVNARTDAPVSSIVGNAFGAHPIREPTIPAGTQHARDLAPKHHTPLAESGATISSALRTAAARERIRAQQDQGPGWKLSKFGKRAEGKLERMSVNPAAVHPAYAEMKRRRAELKAATAKGGLKYADTVRSHQGHAEQEDIPQMDFSGVQREE